MNYPGAVPLQHQQGLLSAGHVDRLDSHQTKLAKQYHFGVTLEANHRTLMMQVALLAPPGMEIQPVPSKFQILHQHIIPVSFSYTS